MTKRAAIYARVSTDEQAEKGYSLPSQLDACRQYAGAHGYAVASEIMDDCSGANLARPGLDLVRAMIDRREVDAVIVYASDRLTRNLAHLLLLREQLLTAGVELHYCNRGKSENTPEGQMTENIEGVFNEYWRAKIAEGSMRGRNKKAQSGKYVLGGKLPFGYRLAEEGRAAIYEPEADVVRQIFAWYVIGDLDAGGPCSLMEVCRRLNDRGSRPQRGERWVPTTILRILKHEIYAGVAHYGKTRKGRRPNGQKLNVKQPRSFWIRIDVPELALVSSDLFDEAQKRIEANKRLAGRNTRHDYLLRGRMRCGRCSRGMSSIVHRHSEVYRCNNASRLKSSDRICSTSIVARKVDAATWGWLSALLNDDDKLQKGLREMQARAEAGAGPKRARLAALECDIEKADRKTQRLISTFAADEDTDDVTKSAVRAEVKAIRQQREALIAERDALAAQLAQAEVTPAAWQSILAMTAAIRPRLRAANPKQRRELIDLMDVRGELRQNASGRWLDVTCAIPAQGQIDLQTLTDSPAWPPSPGPPCARESRAPARRPGPAAG